MARRFSLERAMRNREYRAVGGLLAGFALLRLKVVLPYNFFFVPSPRTLTV